MMKEEMLRWMKMKIKKASWNCWGAVDTEADIHTLPRLEAGSYAHRANLVHRTAEGVPSFR